MGVVKATDVGSLRDLEYLCAIKRATDGSHTLNEVVIMQYLITYPDSRQRDIVEYCEIPRSTVSRILIDFESEGWVTQSDDGQNTYRPSEKAYGIRKEILAGLYSLPRNL